MDTQRIGVVTGPGEVEIREIPRHEPGPHDVLVRIEACALCTWEQRTYSGADKETRYPFVGGHEYAGTIVDVGPDSPTTLQVGDRVAIGPQDIGPHEVQRHILFGDDLWGPFGLGEYRAVPHERAFVIGDGVPFSHACFAEPLACVIRSMDKLAPRLGDDVVVIGAGVIGLLNMQVAQLSGARVIVSDLDADRRAFASRLGAHATIDPSGGAAADQVRSLTGGNGADVIIVAIGNHQANLDALDMVAEFGKVMLFASAHPATELPLDPNFVHRKQVTITGSRHPSRDGFLKAVKLLSKGLVDVGPLIESQMPLDSLEDALKLAIRPDSYRVIVTM